MPRKYTVRDAPRRVRLRWLRKARATRSKNAECRKVLQAQGWARQEEPEVLPEYLGPEYLGAPYPVEVRMPGAEAARRYEQSIGMNPFDQVSRGRRVTVAAPDGRLTTGRAAMQAADGSWVLKVPRSRQPVLATEENIVRVGGVVRKVSKNPELLVYSNPGGRRANMKRRRRRRNSWHGHRKGHRRAALKGWRSRRRRPGRRSRRSGRRRSGRGRMPRTWRATVKRYGVKVGAKMWRKAKRRGRGKH